MKAQANNNILDNILIRCTRENKEELRELVSEYVEDIRSLPDEFFSDCYYGFKNGKYKFFNIHDVNIYTTPKCSFMTLSHVKSFLNKDNTINIINIDSKSFPRDMWVRDKGEDEYVKRTVLCYARNKFIAFCNKEKDLDNNSLHSSIYCTTTYDEAIELEELIILTIEDIAKLANTSVDKLKIIDDETNRV